MSDSDRGKGNVRSLADALRRARIADADRTEEMFLVGVDGEKEALLQILHGTNYAATGLNNSDQIGRAGFNRLMSILAGAAAEHDTYLPSPLITEDNVEKYYDPNSLF